MVRTVGAPSAVVLSRVAVLGRLLSRGAGSQRMFRRSGGRFADKNMRQRKNHEHVPIPKERNVLYAARPGNVNWKSAPSGPLLAHRRPPCASMIACEIDRPMPRPSGL